LGKSQRTGCNPQVPIVVNLDVMLARLEWPPGDLLAFEGEVVTCRPAGIE